MLSHLIKDKRRKNGDFWLTGSESFTMMKNVTESLAGRVAIISLTNLSNREINNEELINIDFDIKKLKNIKTKNTNIKKIFDNIYRGFYPKVIIEKNIDLDLFYESYINTYITRDVSNVKEITNKNSFIKFLKVVACRTATNVNYQTLANEVDITSPTAKAWINNGKYPPLYFYRNNSKEEIDLIIEKDGIMHPIEIKKSANPKNSLKNFSSIEGNIGTGYVFCVCEEVIPISKKDYLVPVGIL